MVQYMQRADSRWKGKGIRWLIPEVEVIPRNSELNHAPVNSYKSIRKSIES